MSRCHPPFGGSPFVWRLSCHAPARQFERTYPTERQHGVRTSPAVSTLQSGCRQSLRLEPRRSGTLWWFGIRSEVVFREVHAPLQTPSWALLSHRRARSVPVLHGSPKPNEMVFRPFGLRHYFSLRFGGDDSDIVEKYNKI